MDDPAHNNANHADHVSAPPPPADDRAYGHVGYTPPGPSLGKLVLDLIGMFAISLPAMGAVFLLTMLCSALFGPFLGPLSAFLPVLGLVLLGSMVRRFKRERGVTLLGYLELATRLNLPLPEFLDTLGKGEGLAVGARAQRMAQTLRAGGGLGEAVCRHAADVPAAQAAVVWRGEQAGRLSAAVARASGNLRRTRQDPTGMRSDAALQYALLVMVVLLGLMGMISALILPKYHEIFNDFDVAMPAITRLTFEWGGAVSPLLVLFAAGAMLALLGWAAYGLVRDSQAVGGTLRRVFEPVIWRVPVLSCSLRSAAWADACFMIEQAMRAGQPLPDAIELAGHPSISGVVDRRLARFAQHLRNGQPPADAARHARLPALIVGMLGTANAAAQPADTFAYLCRYYTHRVSPTEQVVRATALPLLTLALACAVAWFVFALFYPLIVLIERTIDVTGYA